MWEPLLAVFSMALEMSDERSIVDLTLKGLRMSIRIAGTFHMKIPLTSLVACLAKFTGLEAVFSGEIRSKNVMCTRMLLSVMEEDGELLRDTWELALAAISRLVVVYQTSLGIAGDDAFFGVSPRDTTRVKSPNRGLFSTGPSPQEVR